MERPIYQVLVKMKRKESGCPCLELYRWYLSVHIRTGPCPWYPQTPGLVTFEGSTRFRPSRILIVCSANANILYRHTCFISSPILSRLIIAKCMASVLSLENTSLDNLSDNLFGVPIRYIAMHKHCVNHGQSDTLLYVKIAVQSVLLS